MKRIRICIVLCLMIVASHAWAFDEDIAIDEPSFKPENFLDIKAYEFSKLVDEQWYRHPNGWRMRGGSLDYNLAYIDSEIRLAQHLSDKVTMRFEQQYFTYYARKPFQAPLLELGVRPLKPPVELALLGTPTYDKQKADLGLGLTLGHRTGDYFRFAYLNVDRYYNSKNVFDNSYYEKSPHTLSLQGAYRYKQWELRLDRERYDPLQLIIPERNEDFRYRGNKLNFILNYHLTKGALTGITIYGLNIDKSLDNDVENRTQKLNHHMMDVYWAGPYKLFDEMGFGLRLDQFDNRVRDLDNHNGSYDYTFDTLQVYGTLKRDYTSHAAWGLGLYVGDVTRHKDFLTRSTDNNPEKTTQAKLRTSWEYHSQDKRSRFTAHITFNLDGLSHRPGDGGGLSYQGLF
jgi:hypothetical protein